MSIVKLSTVVLGENQNGGTSDPFDSTTADLIVIAVGEYSGGALPDPTDSKSNVWVPMTAKTISNSYAQAWYCFSPITDAAHTVEFAGSNVFQDVVIYVCKGVDVNVPPTESGATGGGVGTNQPGALTPNLDGALLITVESSDTGSGSNPCTIDSGFNIDLNRAQVNGVNIGGAIASKIQATAALINPTWTYTGDAGDVISYGVKMVAFTPAASGLSVSDKARPLLMAY